MKHYRKVGDDWAEMDTDEYMSWAKAEFKVYLVLFIVCLLLLGGCILYIYSDKDNKPKKEDEIILSY